MNFFLGGRGAGPGSQCGVEACTLAFATLRSQDSVRNYAFLRFMGIISTVSRQLRYSPSRACVCLPPGFLTLWLYLPSCRFAHGCCRGLALCVLVILLLFPSAIAAGSLCACLLFFYAFPSAVAAGSLGFARSPRGFAQS